MKHYIVIRNLFLRLLASPFVFALVFIKFNYSIIERTISFIIHGGEWINYDKDKPTIKDIFEELKKQRND
jgi:hypothetical protein